MPWLIPSYLTVGELRLRDLPGSQEAFPRGIADLGRCGASLLVLLCVPVMSGNARFPWRR